MNFSLSCQIGPTKIALLRAESFTARANGFFLKIALCSGRCYPLSKYRGRREISGKRLLKIYGYTRITTYDSAQFSKSSIYSSPFLFHIRALYDVTGGVAQHALKRKTQMLRLSNIAKTARSSRKVPSLSPFIHIYVYVYTHTCARHRRCVARSHTAADTVRLRIRIMCVCV